MIQECGYSVHIFKRRLCYYPKEIAADCTRENRKWLKNVLHNASRQTTRLTLGSEDRTCKPGERNATKFSKKSMRSLFQNVDLK